MSDEDQQEQVRSPETYYMFKPSLVGAPMEFMLHPDNIEWRGGRFSGRIFYRDIRKVRLSFRPVTTENYRFVTEAWSKAGVKITIGSTSWRGLVQQERHNDHYTTFVRELHRRVAAAGGAVQYITGSPVVLYWPGVVVLAALALGMVALAVQAVQSQAVLGAAIVGAMMLFFLWQTANFFRRNVPGTYTPSELPPRVMP